MFSNKSLNSEHKQFVAITLILELKKLISDCDLIKIEEFIAKNKDFLFQFKHIDEEFMKGLCEELHQRQ